MEICVFQGGSYAINVLMQARAKTHVMTGIMLTAGIGADARERGRAQWNGGSMHGSVPRHVQTPLILFPKPAPCRITTS